MPVWIVDPSTAVSDFYSRARFNRTFGSLQVLAQHLAGVAGRKTVVWVSAAFPIPTGLNRSEFLDEMRRTTRALSDAQAVLYPVDARGLVGAITYGRRGAAPASIDSKALARFATPPRRRSFSCSPTVR